MVHACASGCVELVALLLDRGVNKDCEYGVSADLRTVPASPSAACAIAQPHGERLLDMRRSS